MADLTQLQTWLADAESVRHSLAMGEQVAEIWRDGRRVTYSRANLAELTSYIAWLEAEIERKTQGAAGRPRRAAIGTFFGG